MRGALPYHMFGFTLGRFFQRPGPQRRRVPMTFEPKTIRALITAGVFATGSAVSIATAPTDTAQGQQAMSFFITSAGSGDGANLGGLAGADKICQTLATA